MAAVSYLPRVYLQQLPQFLAKEAPAFNLPLHGIYQMKQNGVKTQKGGTSFQKTSGKIHDNQIRRSAVIMSAMYNDNMGFSRPSSGQMINNFYKCINEHNLKQLGDYISEGCYFEECSFPGPFNGKEVFS